MILKDWILFYKIKKRICFYISEDIRVKFLFCGRRGIGIILSFLSSSQYPNFRVLGFYGFYGLNNLKGGQNEENNFPFNSNWGNRV
jgi:hypothetical protein